MHGGDLIFPACYKALHPNRVVSAALPVSPPRFTDGGVLLRIRFIHSKEKIPACRYLIKLPGEGRVLRCIFRLPCVKKCKNRTGNRRINAVKNLMVKLCSCVKTLAAAFRLALLVDAKKIGGIVPQKVCGNAYRALYRRG